jgi:hypothetical protein
MNVHLFELILVDRIVAKGASFPWTGRIAIVGQVLENAGPTENVSTLSNSRGQNFLKGFHTNWALDVAGINHIEDNFLNIFPFNVFIRVIKI